MDKYVIYISIRNTQHCQYERTDLILIKLPLTKCQFQIEGWRYPISLCLVPLKFQLNSRLATFNNIWKFTTM